ncbi:hypothetical protein D3C72_1684630 [compost metagenome]
MLTRAFPRRLAGDHGAYEFDHRLANACARRVVQLPDLADRRIHQRQQDPLHAGMCGWSDKGLAQPCDRSIRKRVARQLKKEKSHGRSVAEDIGTARIIDDDSPLTDRRLAPVLKQRRAAMRLDDQLDRIGTAGPMDHTIADDGMNVGLQPRQAAVAEHRRDQPALFLIAAVKVEANIAEQGAGNACKIAPSGNIQGCRGGGWHDISLTRSGSRHRPADRCR